jgi:hypothetical protein
MLVEDRKIGTALNSTAAGRTDYNWHRTVVEVDRGKSG